MSVEFAFAALSDVGRERTENQDAFGSTSVDGVDFYIVCDGMGGHAGGSTASRLGVSTIEEKLALAKGPVPARLVEALEEANSVIFNKAQRNRELRGMGTTVVVLAADPETGRCWIAHVGDSRIYRLRGSAIEQLTRDHTMVQRLIDDGILEPEAAENHPNANVISRSLGGREAVEVEARVNPIKLESGDVFVLCSDGLHGLVSEQEIARTVCELEPDQAARRLVDRANEEGGPDNITVEIVVVGDRPAPIEEYSIVRPPLGEGAKRRLREREEAEQRAREEALAVTAPLENPDSAAEVQDAVPTEVRAVVAAEPGSGDDESTVRYAPVAIGLLLAALAVALYALVNVARGDAPDESPPADVVESDQH